MIVIKSFLVSSMAAIASASLWISPKNPQEDNIPVVFSKSGKTTNIKWKKIQETFQKLGLGTTNAESHMKLVHFNEAQDSSQVLSLPTSFFKDVITPEQVIEIILNSNLEDCLGTKVPKFSKDKKEKSAVANKMRILQKQIGNLNARNLGEDLDAVVSKIPSSLYINLSPLTALLSKSFPFTKDSIVNLFGLATDGLTAPQKQLLATVLDGILEVASHPGSIFMTTNMLVKMLENDPSLYDPFGKRVMKLVEEIANIVAPLVEVKDKLKTGDAKNTKKNTDTDMLPPVTLLKNANVDVDDVIVDDVDVNVDQQDTANYQDISDVDDSDSKDKNNARKVRFQDDSSGDDDQIQTVVPQGNKLTSGKKVRKGSTSGGSNNDSSVGDPKVDIGSWIVATTDDKEKSTSNALVKKTGTSTKATNSLGKWYV